MVLRRESANHPCVVWGACFLWVVSVLAIIWSIILFFTVGDILYLTGTDIVNALVLLSGITMLPTNLQMLYAIGYNRKIENCTRVVCCPIWLCLIWSVFINFCGVVLCFQKIAVCRQITEMFIQNSMQLYRVAPRHKHFIDNIQWFMQCCGLNSYRDWFHQDWYDKVRDYEWDPSESAKSPRRAQHIDSVPLSCCKSGSCISNYLSELGTYSINTNGCLAMLCRLIITFMIVHIIVFSSVIIVQIAVIRFILTRQDCNECCSNSVDPEENVDTYKVKHIMKAKDFVSSESARVEDEDTENDDDV